MANQKTKMRFQEKTKRGVGPVMILIAALTAGAGAAYIGSEFQDMIFDFLGDGPSPSKATAAPKLSEPPKSINFN